MRHLGTPGIAMTIALSIAVAGTGLALADDGTITVHINQATALKKDNDAFLSEQQDFYVCGSLDYSPDAIAAPTISNRDAASWIPPGQMFKLVPGKNQRFFDFYFELWDNDQGCLGCGDDDDFDISPQNGPPPPLINGHLAPCTYLNTPTGGFPHLTYDVCTGSMFVNGVNGSSIIPIGSNAATLSGKNTTNGTFDNWATLGFDVVRQPSNWLPDDVAVESVEIVQSVYKASEAVVDKPTSLIVRISSTYPFDILAPVDGHMTDGITAVNDVQMVTIKGGSPTVPGETLVSLFDGTTAQPYRPQKSFLVGTGKVSGWANITYSESVSPNAPPQLMDCANLDNTGNATDLPLVHTQDLVTLYERFDYQEDDNLIALPALQSYHDREENFRLDSWPLASLNTSVGAAGLVRDHGSNLLCPFEPTCTLLHYNGVAAAMNVDRLVLTVRQNWFADNAFRHQFIGNNSIGLSLGPFAPRAVLAENGYFGNSTHELGHTYNLSQHACTNASPPFGPGCMDEYTYPVSDGAPFAAMGFDVAGTVYPSGIHQTTWRSLPLACPATPPQSRDICAPNLMDANSGSGYKQWLDTFTYQYLMDNTIPHSDPPVVNVTGYVELPNGQGDGSVPPLVTGALPFYALQFMGIQDFDPAPPSPMGETFVGTGPFRVRLVTPAGVSDYRFEPRFFDDPPNAGLLAGFSLNVPWDPTTTSIELIGPTDPRDTSCWNRFCAGDGVVLDARPVTPMPPTVSDLRAGRDATAPPTPPGNVPATPTIGPGHSAVVSWTALDPDSPELHATIILVKQGGPAGGSSAPVPVAFDITDGTLQILHDRLADDPGIYTGRILVSDGANTSETTNGALFNICNTSNGGIDICGNGIDDDCDGIVDDPLPPGPSSVELNPQPFPPGPAGFTWPADPNAQSYDVVYGDLILVRNSGGGFAGATLGCLAENTTSTSVAASSAPSPGQVFFFVARGTNCTGPGTYDSGDPGQVISRDAGINGSTASCRP
jgi:hypothetical protein